MNDHKQYLGVTGEIEAPEQFVQTSNGRVAVRMTACVTAQAVRTIDPGDNITPRDERREVWPRDASITIAWYTYPQPPARTVGPMYHDITFEITSWRLLEEYLALWGVDPHDPDHYDFPEGK